MSSRARAKVAALACAVAASGGARSAVIEVPDDYPTIQAAIDAATDDDEIAVAPGVYPEAIDFLGKAIWVYGTDGAGATTIDATGLGTSVVTCTSGEGTMILEGFTITGGVGTIVENEFGLFRFGGGMYTRGTSPMVLDCIFSGNEALDPAPSFGGGMFCDDGGEPTVSGCLFEGNTANGGGGIAHLWTDTLVIGCSFVGNTAEPIDGNDWGQGGGAIQQASPTYVDCWFEGNVGHYGGAMANNSFPADTKGLIVGCTFIDNEAGYSGGAIDNIGDPVWAGVCDPVIIDCLFEGNTATWGGAIRNRYADGWMVNSRVVGNHATSRGGGMINTMGSTPLIVNSLFIDNLADDNGGAVYNEIYQGHASSPELVNCTIIGNVAGAGSGGAIRSTAGSASLGNCIVWDNGPLPILDLGGAQTTVTYSDVEGGYTGVGNIDLDPMCVDLVTRDMALLPGSPCVDTGDDAALPPDELDLDEDGDTTEPIPHDLDGLGRIAGLAVDMGCYEWHLGDINRDGVVDGADLGLLLGAWGECNACPADLSSDGMVDGADLGLLLGAWGT